MFIRRSEYRELIGQIDSLGRQLKRHAEFLHNDHKKIENINNRVERLGDIVGEDSQPSVLDSLLQHYYLGGNEPSNKRFTLFERVEKIIDYLGLTVSETTAEFNLVPKKKKTVKKSKAITKGGK